MDIAHYHVDHTRTKAPFCHVYLATEVHQQQPVELRVFDKVLSADKRFQRQFKALHTKLTGVSHPNLLPLLNMGIDGSVYYTASQYLPYGTLKQQQAYISPENSLQYILTIAHALSELHDLGIAHGGIRLSNIYFNEHGEVVLGSVDLAQLFIYQCYLRESNAQVAKLPLSNIPPELLNGKKINYRSDFYHLGLALYELLTGQPALHQAKTLKAYHQHGIIPQLPTELRHLQPLLTQLLSKDPLQRMVTGKALAQAIEHIEWPHSPRTHTIPQPPRANRTARWVALGMAAACIPFLPLGISTNPDRDTASSPIALTSPIAADSKTRLPRRSVSATPPTRRTTVESPTAQIAILNPPEPTQLKLKPNAQQIRLLHQQAQRQLHAFQLTLPKGNNALASYHAIQQLDPNNAQASAILTAIANRYCALAERHFADDDWVKSQHMVDKGLSLVTEHRGLLTLQAALTDIQQQPRRAQHINTEIALPMAQPIERINTPIAFHHPMSARFVPLPRTQAVNSQPSTQPKTTQEREEIRAILADIEFSGKRKLLVFGTF